MNVKAVGDGKVYLIAGAGEIYTDIAARFCKSERAVKDIIGSPYNKELVKRILNAGHYAALEFDYFLFGYEGYSRVTEVQLVRKRLASYLIKSGRVELNGKRKANFVVPEELLKHNINFQGSNWNGINILALLEAWYNEGIKCGFKEEELRYFLPQATESKGIVGMNAHALRDFFEARCCMNAQAEIRDLANKMLKLCKVTKPDLFEGAGAPCIKLGYCPQNELQNIRCKGKVRTHKEVLKILKGEHKNE